MKRPVNIALLCGAAAVILSCIIMLNLLKNEGEAYAVIPDTPIPHASNNDIIFFDIFLPSFHNIYLPKKEILL